VCAFCAISHLKLNGITGGDKNDRISVYIDFDNAQIVVQGRDNDCRYDIACCPFCGREL